MLNLSSNCCLFSFNIGPFTVSSFSSICLTQRTSAHSTSGHVTTQTCFDDKAVGVVCACWWGSLDSTPGNFDFTIFLTLNNYTRWQISQEQQPFPRKAVHGLKIDSTKTMNWIRQLCLVAHVDQVLPAIWMILKILTQCSQFFWQSSNLSFNILQHDAIGQVQLSGQLIISNPVTITLSDPLSRAPPSTCMTAVNHCHYCAGILVHYFGYLFRRFHIIWWYAHQYLWCVVH